mmetsp:Transcript_13522/g.26620  ORF Transcript_13522/g.26620 Transcript_13522/m.26620 type:complete len:217 (-) Transcript_13522:2273-2923(-)
MKVCLDRMWIQTRSKRHIANAWYSSYMNNRMSMTRQEIWQSCLKLSRRPSNSGSQYGHVAPRNVHTNAQWKAQSSAWANAAKGCVDLNSMRLLTMSVETSRSIAWVGSFSMLANNFGCFANGSSSRRSSSSLASFEINSKYAIIASIVCRLFTIRSCSQILTDSGCLKNSWTPEIARYSDQTSESASKMAPIQFGASFRWAARVSDPLGMPLRIFH